MRHYINPYIYQANLSTQRVANFCSDILGCKFANDVTITIQPTAPFNGDHIVTVEIDRSSLALLDTSFTSGFLSSRRWDSFFEKRYVFFEGNDSFTIDISEKTNGKYGLKHKDPVVIDGDTEAVFTGTVMPKPGNELDMQILCFMINCGYTSHLFIYANDLDRVVKK